MACLVGYGAYRTELVEHAVNVRLVGPDGRQHRQLSRSLSRMWRKQRDFEKGARFLRAFVWTLNVSHAAMPDVADRYVAGVEGCRDAQDQWLVSANIKTKDAGERDGSMWLHPRKGIYSRVSDALIATGLVTEGLAHEVFGGQDPSKVDHRVSRQAARREEGRANPKARSDTDRRLRLGSDPGHAPRYDDPRFWEHWEEGLVRSGAPEVFRHVGALGRYGAGRAFQVLALDMFDLLVRPAAEGEIPAPNKGSEGERSMVFKPVRSRYDALLGWVAGARAKVSGVSLDRLRAMAADPRERGKLTGMPLFTEDGVNPIKYDRLYRVFRKAAERAGLWIDDDEHRSTGARRFVSFHYLRHEYVHRRLDEIDEMEPGKRAAARAALIAYMRWGRTSGERMLEWYSAHHLVKVARSEADEHNVRTEAVLAAGASTPAGLAVRRSDADQLLEGLA